MKINFKLKVNHTPKDEEIEDIKSLYLTSFPAVERKSFKLMLNKYYESLLDFLYFYDNEFIGFAIIMKDGNKVLVDYLAIKEDFRNLGYGSLVLKYIKEFFKDKNIIYEIEDDEIKSSNLEERKRRKNFYLKNGLSETTLVISLFGVQMKVLAYKDINFSDYFKIYANTYIEYIDKFKKGIIKIKEKSL